MPDQITLTAVAELATHLPPAEQRQLAESILRRLTATAAPDGPRRRSWREIRGSVEHPLCGEDAQASVTRGRQESDEHRERQGGGKR